MSGADAVAGAGGRALPFDAVLFDCDGVLADSEGITNEVLRGMLGELGWHLEPAECVRLFVGRALKDEAPLIRQHTGFEVTDSWLADFRRRRNEGLRPGLREIPGAGAAVRAVQAAYGDRIACVSGADRPKIEMQLAALGLAEAFGDRVFSGLEYARTKPAPDVYLAAASALGVDPSRAAVVEDTVAGVTAGVAAGATVFAFAPGDAAHTAPEALLGAGARTVFTAMADLPALLGA